MNELPGREDVMLAAVAVVRAQARLGRLPDQQEQVSAALEAAVPYLERHGGHPGWLSRDPVLALLLAQLAAMAGGGFLAAAVSAGYQPSEELLLAKLDDLEQAILAWCRQPDTGGQG